MWKTLLKLGLAYAFSAQMKNVLGQKVLPAVGHYAAATSAGVAQGLSTDWHRVIRSVIVAVVAVIGSLLGAMVGMIWFLVWAMDHPYRDWLFAGALATPLLIALVAMLYVKNTWKNNGILNDTRLQLHHQWQELKQSFQ